jgi:hypothetical protein
MNLYSRLFLVSCLLTSIMYGQQRFFLANPTTTPATSQVVIRDSEDLNLEHALFDYHHYYSNPCGERPWFDLQVAPFYTHLKSIVNSDIVYPDTYKDGSDFRSTTQFAGAQFQAQLNICNFWIRANMQAGQLKNTFANLPSDYLETYKETKELYEFGGADDVTLKAGYDFFFCNDDHHVGIYALGGFPVNNKDAAIFADATAFKAAPLFNNDVRLGILSYRAGAGLNSAFTLYNCDESRLTWHADVQYAYAFPRTYAEIKSATTTYPEDTEIRYTPGQFVSAWTALHYGVCNWGFEFGSSFETMFDEKTSLQHASSASTLATLSLVEKPGYTVSFLAKPYVAAAYNTTICENPFTVGLGIGYEYDKMHELPADAVRVYDAFQGVNVWGNLTYSF